jgi:hypothetical protein
MANKKNVKRKPVPAGDRMRFLRRKAADGSATESEMKELEKLFAREEGGGTLDQTFADDAPPPAADASPEEQPELPLDAPPPPPAAPPPPPPPVHRLKGFVGKAPPPPPPPRVDRDPPKEGKAKSGGEWRGKYEEAAQGTGRERTVMFFADRWLGALTAMSEAIKTVGASPMVDVSSPELKAVLVLTVDDLLPQKVQVTPAHMAAFATTSLMVQTFAHRKAIGAEAQKVKDRVDHRKAREAAQKEQQHGETAPNPIPPTPPPANPAPATVPASPGVNGAPVGLGAIRPAIDGANGAGGPKYDGPTDLNPGEII